jgi:hypothetical protein
VTDERLSHRRLGVEASVHTAAIWATVAEHASRRQAELDRPLTVLDLGGERWTGRAPGPKVTRYVAGDPARPPCVDAPQNDAYTDHGPSG